MSAKVPPHSPEAEAAVLGAIMLRSESLARVAALRPDDFYDPRHIAVFAAIKRLGVEGKPIDPVTIADELARAGKLKSVGGLSFLSGLLSGVLTADNAEHYAKIVADKALVRRVIAAGSTAADKGLRRVDVIGVELLAELCCAVETLKSQLAQAAPAVCVQLSTVQPERVTWLWPARIPFGKLTMIDGDPGLGKSTLTLHLAAAASTGRAIAPGEPASHPVGVILMGAEDGVGDTVRPRLGAAGADLERVFSMSEIPDGKTPRPIVLPDDIACLEQEIIRHGAKLVVIDPLMSFLGGSVDANKDQDVRRALMVIAKMAERTGAAVVMLRHLRKVAGSSAVHAGGGSIGIIGAARAGLLVARDPDDPGLRVLAVSKMNLALEPPALRYRLVDDGSGVAHVEWVVGACAHRADDLVTQAPADDPRARREACDFLRRMLANGPISAAELKRAADAEQIAEMTLKRARKQLGVRAEKGKGVSKAWMVSLTPLTPLTPFHTADVEEEGQEDQEDQEDKEGHAGENGNGLSPDHGEVVR